MLPQQLIQRLERFRDGRIPGALKVLEGPSGRLPGGTEVQSVYLVVAEPNLFPYLPYVLAEIGLRSSAHAVWWQCDLLFCPPRFREKLLEILDGHDPVWHPPRPLFSRLRQRWEIIRRLRSREVPVSENVSVLV